MEQSKENEAKQEEIKEEEAPKTEDTNEAKEPQTQEKKEEKPKEPTLEEQLEALKKDNAELKDSLLRKAAEFDNYRKRMIKEKQDAFDYANQNLLKDLLDSIDNFDRTIQAASTATDVKSIADGIAMINRSLVSMLENKYELVSYGKAGDSFDPQKHEAIGKSVGDTKEPVLQEVYLKGYMLKDRVIRHAKVMVLMPKDSE